MVDKRTLQAVVLRSLGAFGGELSLSIMGAWMTFDVHRGA